MTMTGAGVSLASMASSASAAAVPIPPIERLFATIVEGAFDLLDELGDLGLVAYLHAPHDEQPLLFLRRPALDGLSSTETFRLMHTITMLSNGRKPAAAFRHGQLDGHYVRTAGEASDGLFVFGGIQRQAEARRMTAIARAFARVLHQFHLEDDGSDPLPEVALGRVGQLVRAEATDRSGSDEVVGSAMARTADEAVARAVVTVLAPQFGFDEIRTIELDSRSAVLVVLRDESAHLQLGLAISDDDIVRTAALATRRAITRVPDPT